MIGFDLQRFADVVHGSDDNDTMSNHDDGVMISLGAGNDSLQNYGSNVTLVGGAGNDSIVLNEGADNVVDGGNDGDYILSGQYFSRGSKNSTLVGGAGNDTIISNGSRSSLVGGDGNDVIANGYYYYEPWDTFYENNPDGDATLDDYNGSNVLIDGGEGDDSIRNSGDNVTVRGGAGNDTINRAAVYQYTSGNDIITSYVEGDTIQLLNDSNLIRRLNDGSDVILQLNDGTLTIKYAASQSITVVDSAGAVFALNTLVGSEGNDIASNSDNGVIISLGAGNDFVTNTGSDVTIVGGAGNDSINRADVYQYSSGNDVITSYVEGDTIQLLNDSSLTRRLNDGNDVILQLNDGTLTIKYAASKAVTVVDSVGTAFALNTLVGSEGNDTASNYADGVMISLGAGNDSLVLNEGSDNVVDGGEDDDYILNGQYFSRGSKNSTLVGGTGNDTIISNGSSSSLVGGDGNDVVANGYYYYEPWDTFYENNPDGDATLDDYNGSNVLIDGGAGDDSIRNRGANVTVCGGAGNDTINRAAVYQYTSGNDVITNYVEGDTVQLLNDASLIRRLDNGSDMILQLDDGTLTIKYAASKAVTIVDSMGAAFALNTLVGSEGSDTASNSDDGVMISLGAGNDSFVLNEGSDNIVDGGDDNDYILNGQYFSRGSKNSTLVGGAGNDTIISNGSRSSLVGGDGNDMIANGYYYYESWDTFYENNPDGDATLDDHNGSNVLIDGGAGDDSIRNRGDNVTIDAGEGNDSIYNNGFDVIINVDGNLTVNNYGSAFITGSNDDNFISLTGYEGSTTVDGGKGNDTIVANNQAAETFLYSGGNVLIENYSHDDTLELVNSAISNVTTDGGDLIFGTSDGSITLKNMTNHAITIKDADGNMTTQVYGTGYTPRDVMKNYVQAAARSMLRDLPVVDEAIKASSHFNSLQEVIDKMVSDCRNVNDADKFLRDYCGIIDDNDDTGAVLGWENGGLTAKTSEDMLREEGDAVYPTVTSFTVRGLTINVPEKNTLSEKEQLVVQGVYSWWAENALKLIEESYDLKFDGQSIELSFFNDNTAFAWGYGGPGTVSVNMAYTSFDADNKNGNGLDGLFAHELTHVAQGDFGIWNGMPNYMTEGMANLTAGGDDYIAMAGNADSLATYLKIDNDFSEDGNVYAAGYLFWRYYMKQAADSYDSLKAYSWSDNAVLEGTSESELLTASGEGLTLNAGAGNDTVTAYGRNEMIDGGEGDDSIANRGSDVTVAGGAGNDTINRADVYQYSSGDDLITSYVEGDIIQLLNDSSLNRRFNDGSDVILQLNDGTLTIKYAASQSITVVDSAGNALGLNTIVGSEGNDTAYNSDDGVMISLGAGNDSFVLNEGSDNIVDGGDDDDYILNGQYFSRGSKNSTLVGGAGNDTIISNGSRSSLSGGDGNDVIANGYYYYEPWDTFYENNPDGDATLNDYNGSNVLINGGAGDDSIHNRGANVTIAGGSGNDTINHAAHYIYTDGDGNDLITNYSSDDTIHLIAGDNISSLISDSDAILNIGDGSITIKNAAAFSLNVVDGNNTPLTLSPPTVEGAINLGEGSYLFDESTGVTDDPIEVFYYRPTTWKSGDSIAFVFHGMNRIATNYRSSWERYAAENNLLIICPEFTEEKYPGSRYYNTGNVTDNSGNLQPEEDWVFDVVDRIIVDVKQRIDSADSKVLTFGHSAGAQMVHRYALFDEDSESDLIISANAGWYTMPDEDIRFPYGIGAVNFSDEQLERAFAKTVVIMLGEEDTLRSDDLRTTSEADAQGLNRLERGKNFFEACKEKAAELNAPFNWKLVTVPNVGHSNSGTAQAAMKVYNDWLSGADEFDDDTSFSDGDDTTAPVDDTTSTAPVDDTTSTAPVDDTTTTAPADDTTSTAPVDDTTSTAPVDDTTSTAPVDDTTSTAPDDDTTSTAPDDDTTSIAPVDDTTSTAPVDDTTSTAPVDDTTSIAPVDDTTSTAPVDDTTSTAPVDDTTSVVPSSDDSDADVFIYSVGGGRKVIGNKRDASTLYDAADKVVILGNDISRDDLILKDKRNTLTVTFKNDKGSRLTINKADSLDAVQFYFGSDLDAALEGDPFSYGSTDGVSLNSKRTQVTVQPTVESATIDLLSISMTAKTLDGSAAGADVHLIGNNQANVLIARDFYGSTLDGGIGNDKLYGGNGDDVFVYSVGGGKDVIGNKRDITSCYDFADKVVILGDDISRDDLILKDKRNTLTVSFKNDKRSRLTINKADSLDAVQFYFGTDVDSALESDPFSYGATDAVTLNVKGTLVGVLPTVGSATIDLSTISMNAKTLDGSAADGELYLIGNGQSNVLIADDYGSTLDGGAGNDKLYGGDGADVFIFDGAGKDAIFDYESSDRIVIDGEFDDVKIKSRDVVLKSGKNSLTLKNAVGEEITVTDGNGLTSSYEFSRENNTLEKALISSSARSFASDHRW